MKRGAWVAAFAWLLVSCRLPWTVRPIDDAQRETGAQRPFDAAAYAASIWDSRVIPAASAAPDFAHARLSRRPVLVKDTARVLRADASRGRLVLDIAPYDGRPDAELAADQIRGTALRDALPFIQFSQFVNQVDYAHAANALNDRAARAAAAAMAEAKPGMVLYFAGALDGGGDGLPQIVPVVATREPARP